MSRETKVVLALVIAALLCGSVPVVTPLVFGYGVQSGAWTNDAIYSIVFLTITKLSWVYIAASIIGFGLSRYFYNRNPRKFRVTSILFLLLFIGTILSAMASGWITLNNIRNVTSTTETTLAYSMYGCVSALTNVTVWTMLLVVIFSKKLNVADEVAPTQN
jgi:hypothetical protein